jgi:hypothetical protein
MYRERTVAANAKTAPKASEIKIQFIMFSLRDL